MLRNEVRAGSLGEPVFFGSNVDQRMRRREGLAHSQTSMITSGSNYKKEYGIRDAG